jgi:hypothetical protein
VLQRAAAAGAEMRAARRNAAARCSAFKGNDPREVEALPPGQHAHARGLAGQRAVDEHDLALGIARYAAALCVERIDAKL